jgi:Fe-S cluster biogenesis protein NfuA
MTMTMGLEKKLKIRIPQITAVVQAKPEAPTLTVENVEVVLAGVRPFLAVAGGTITVDGVKGAGGPQPGVVLQLRGAAAALQSVKTEIQQRIQRHFVSPVQVEWKDY